ncbi:MAG: zf-DHHC-domain-containing protein [Amphiamblys sp. WSBS2006]|nr:MAG: zf-DHHC-domain-containing protein [Amphiamblys sp. WSBS2006]
MLLGQIIVRYFLLCLIFGVGFFHTYFVQPRMFHLEKRRGGGQWKDTAVFGYFLVMGLWSFVLASHTVTVQTKRGTTEYTDTKCRACCVYKAVGARHCSSCRRCVLRMDHHCEGLGCCIGQNNYGYFVRCVLFLSLTALKAFLDELRLMSAGGYCCRWMVWFTWKAYFYFCASVFLGAMFLFHMYNALQGRTYINYLAEKKRRPFSVRNIPKMCGSNHLAWILPVFDGEKCLAKEHSSPRLELAWMFRYGEEGCEIADEWVSDKGRYSRRNTEKEIKKRD